MFGQRFAFFRQIKANPLYIGKSSCAIDKKLPEINQIANIAKCSTIFTDIYRHSS